MEKTNDKNIHEIRIEWEGPLNVDQVIENKTDEGLAPYYEGNDYGVYQIYGKHILCGSDTLLYVGKTTEAGFSRRFATHKRQFLDNEEEIEVYLGRIDDQKKYSHKDNWKSWEKDVDLAEKIIIYKYSPNYNSRNISDSPSLQGFAKVYLLQEGKKNRLDAKDVAPDDF
jgi:hypothetical protein